MQNPTEIKKVVCFLPEKSFQNYISGSQVETLRSLKLTPATILDMTTDCMSFPLIHTQSYIVLILHFSLLLAYYKTLEYTESERAMIDSARQTIITHIRFRKPDQRLIEFVKKEITTRDCATRDVFTTFGLDALSLPMIWLRRHMESPQLMRRDLFKLLPELSIDDEFFVFYFMRKDKVLNELAQKRSSVVVIDSSPKRQKIGE
jgi:hypothetical protein